MGKTPNEFDEIGRVRLVVEHFGDKGTRAVEAQEPYAHVQEEEHELRRAVLDVEHGLGKGQDLVDRRPHFCGVGHAFGDCSIGRTKEPQTWEACGACSDTLLDYNPCASCTKFEPGGYC